MASVIILPVIRIDYLRSIEGVDLGNQTLAPSSDRRNVIELWRVRELKEFERCFASYPHQEKPA